MVLLRKGGLLWLDIFVIWKRALQLQLLAGAQDLFAPRRSFEAFEVQATLLFATDPPQVQIAL